MAALQLDLPTSEGRLETYQLSGTPLEVRKPAGPFNRVAFSAAHVVANPLSGNEPSAAAAIDWEATLAYRRYLLDQGMVGLSMAFDLPTRWVSRCDPPKPGMVPMVISG